MSKPSLLEHPLTLNLVFVFCLAGSILFAVVSEMKSKQNNSCQAVNLSEPAPLTAKPRSAG